MISISLEPRVILELVNSAHVTDEFLPINSLNADSFGWVDKPVWDPSHVEEKTVPVFVVLVFTGDERHHSHSTILVEPSTGNFASEPVDGSADDLD